MNKSKRNIAFALCLLAVAACSRAPGEPTVEGSARWEAPIAAPATLTVELVPVSNAAERPVFSVTQALEADTGSAEFRLPYEPLPLDSEYRLSARLDHAEGLLLSQEEERLTLRGEGFHRKLRLTPP